MKKKRFIIEYYEDYGYFYVDFKPYVRDKVASTREDLISWLDLWLEGMIVDGER